MISKGKILFAKHEGVHVLKFVGDVRVKLGVVLTDFMERVRQINDLKSIVIDLTDTTNLDSTTLGMLAKISLRSQEVLNLKPTLVSTNENINRILNSMGFVKVFVIVEDFCSDCGDLKEMVPKIGTEAALREQVLEAHRVLMSLNSRNHEAFHDLVTALEKEQEKEKKAESIRKAS